MICPKCGCRVEPGMKKCPVCDSTLDNEYTRYEKKKNTEESSRFCMSYI